MHDDFDEILYRHIGCTAVGDGNTSPTSKLHEFHHLPPTFSHCLMHISFPIDFYNIFLVHPIQTTTH